MTDIQGKEIKLNDYVAYAATGRWSNLVICKVVGFTPKGVKIKKPFQKKPSSILNPSSALLVISARSVTASYKKEIDL
jgi:hypothetical protein